jgi:ABC-type amino acid transport system permease subunit
VNYNWNWGIFFQTSPDGVHTYLETLLLGTGWTLATALSAWCLALAMGSLVGVIRTTPNPWLVRLGTLCGNFPQHPAAGADVPVVLRATRAPADPTW